MTTRTDVHSPGSIIPADYTFLFAYAHPSTADGWPVSGFNTSLLIATRTGRPHSLSPLHRIVQPIIGRNGERIRFSKIHKHGPCDVCGAHHIEGSVFLHEPSGEAIALGWKCAEKMDLDYDEGERAAISGQRKDIRLAVILKARRFAFLRAFVEDTPAEFRAALRTNHHIVRDIRARIIRQVREPSEAQANLVRKIARDEEARAKLPVERHVSAPISEGRQRIEGKIVSVKWHDSQYGGAYKITVKIETPDGSWLTWGTLPGKFDDVAQEITAKGLRGATIAFDAKLSRSPDSEHFSFFKRPTKSELLKLDSDEARERLERHRENIDEVESDPVEPGRDLQKWLEKQKAVADALAKLLF